jgi:glycosyltransferase involved in cell wall biosynthesis
VDQASVNSGNGSVLGHRDTLPGTGARTVEFTVHAPYPDARNGGPKKTVGDHGPMATVVHVLAPLDRGGVAGVALDLCHAIPEDEIRQVFLTLGRREGQLAPRFREAGARVQLCPHRPLPFFVPRLWRRLRAVRPDAVVSHVSFRSGIVLAIAKLTGVPIRIARLQSEGDWWPDNPLRRCQAAVLRALLRRSATDVLGVTKAALALAGKANGDPRYRVMPNGVDVERFAVAALHRQPSTAPRLIHIGRAAPEKNRGFLLTVHAEAQRLDDGTTLTLVGPGGTSDLSTAERATAIACPSIRLTGETDQPERALADSDVLLLPSHYEGLPGVVLEALAAGVPVLASDLPGLRDLAAELEGITLLPLAAGPAEWACAALRLARTTVRERDRIVERLRRSPFTLASTVDQWRTLWRRS